MAHSGATGLVENWRLKVAPSLSTLSPRSTPSNPQSPNPSSISRPLVSSASTAQLTQSQLSVRHFFHFPEYQLNEYILVREFTPNLCPPENCEGLEGQPRCQGSSGILPHELPQHLHPLRHQASRQFRVTLGKPGH